MGTATGSSCPTGAGHGVRCERDVEDAVPYGVDKTPVGRGQCAPPSGVRRVIGGGTHGCRPTDIYNFLCETGDRKGRPYG